MPTHEYELQTIRPIDTAKRRRVAGGISELHLKPFVLLHTHNIGTGMPRTRAGRAANLAAAGTFYKLFGTSVPNPFIRHIEGPE